MNVITYAFFCIILINIHAGLEIVSLFTASNKLFAIAIVLFNFIFAPVYSLLTPEGNYIFLVLRLSWRRPCLTNLREIEYLNSLKK